MASPARQLAASSTEEGRLFPTQPSDLACPLCACHPDPSCQPLLHLLTLPPAQCPLPAAQLKQLSKPGGPGFLDSVLYSYGGPDSNGGINRSGAIANSTFAFAIYTHDGVIIQRGEACGAESCGQPKLCCRMR
jgi:hypothetical protein